MNLFDILSFNERQIVYSDVADKVLITWNQSKTLQCFQLSGDSWHETGCKTLEEKPSSFLKALALAKAWHELNFAL